MQRSVLASFATAMLLVFSLSIPILAGLPFICGLPLMSMTWSSIDVLHNLLKPSVESPAQMHCHMVDIEAPVKRLQKW